jgi:citrate lyase synthetase
VQFAASQVGWLYVFVDPERDGLFRMSERLHMARAAIAEAGVGNAIALPGCVLSVTERYVDSLTMAEWDGRAAVSILRDVEAFARYVAPLLNIGACFAGKEPYDLYERQFNAIAKLTMREYGIDYVIVSREELGGAPISASWARAALRAGDLGAVSLLTPPAAFKEISEKYRSGALHLGMEKGVAG